jgi:hypothetical protein
MSETLELRAARYFGHHDKPRQSVRLNNRECLIVAEHTGADLLVMHYQEFAQHGPRGNHFKLTPRAAKELLEAVEAFYVAP